MSAVLGPSLPNNFPHASGNSGALEELLLCARKIRAAGDGVSFIPQRP